MFLRSFFFLGQALAVVCLVVYRHYKLSFGGTDSAAADRYIGNNSSFSQRERERKKNVLLNAKIFCFFFEIFSWNSHIRRDATRLWYAFKSVEIFI